MYDNQAVTITCSGVLISMKLSQKQFISVFISYSRKDAFHAEMFTQALREREFRVIRDLDDILPTEEWEVRLKNLICEADAVVFLLSPNSVSSEECEREVRLANKYNKKIAPIVVTDVPGRYIPPSLSKLNYIFAVQEVQFQHAIISLCDALKVNASWIREHSRLTVLAERWNASNRSPSRLLKSEELLACLEWERRKTPSVPELGSSLQEFIDSSAKARDRELAYFSIRSLAEANQLEPLLEEHIQLLEKEVKRLDEGTRKTTYLRENEYAAEKREHIVILKNFMEGGGRWHPLAAEHIHSTGAELGYQEIYKFPCCGTLARFPDHVTPLQFRSDGCEQNTTEQ